MAVAAVGAAERPRARRLPHMAGRGNGQADTAADRRSGRRRHARSGGQAADDCHDGALQPVVVNAQLPSKGPLPRRRPATATRPCWTAPAVRPAAGARACLRSNCRHRRRSRRYCRIALARRESRARLQGRTERNWCDIGCALRVPLTAAPHSKPTLNSQLIASPLSGW